MLVYQRVDRKLWRNPWKTMGTYGNKCANPCEIYEQSDVNTHSHLKRHQQIKKQGRKWRIGFQGKLSAHEL